VDHLASALAHIDGGFQATVDAGQRRLDDLVRPAAMRTLRNQRRTCNQHDGDLRMAMESLLLCKQALAITVVDYQAQLNALIKSLDGALSLPAIRAADPIIGQLLENESELRSVLIDVSAKSKAVSAALLSDETPP
jgi:hypothetical protein